MGKLDMMSGAIRNTIIKGLQVNKISLSVALLILLLLPALPAISQIGSPSHLLLQGAVVRGDTSKAELALVFTGDEYADGGVHIIHVLKQKGIKASFFLTGKFYRNAEFEELIQGLVEGGHYLGAHSDQHLLYCDWVKRDSLLVTQDEFHKDMQDNYKAMANFSIKEEDAPFFLPPYEWYNDSISSWTRQMGLELINHTHGSLSHADYTVPGTRGYRSSEEIFQSILDYETSASKGLNGFILLSHIGTAPERTDKFYFYLEKLLEELKSRGYQFKRIDELLAQPLH
jgi:peptidoglycan/xylan/chitin deacetylase (PgdA/CDA1 family)